MCLALLGLLSLLCVALRSACCLLPSLRCPFFAPLFRWSHTLLALLALLSCLLGLLFCSCRACFAMRCSACFAGWLALLALPALLVACLLLTELGWSGLGWAGLGPSPSLSPLSPFRFSSVSLSGPSPLLSACRRSLFQVPLPWFLCFVIFTRCPQSSLLAWLAFSAWLCLAYFSVLVLLSLPCFACFALVAFFALLAWLPSLRLLALFAWLALLRFALHCVAFCLLPLLLTLHHVSSQFPGCWACLFCFACLGFLFHACSAFVILLCMQ